MSSLATNLKELRFKTGAKQIALAKCIGVLPRTIRFYEAGKLEPNVNALIKIADFYNVSLDYLVGRSTIKERR
ncbi:MAG: helix-turn-helix domain-containing protein [Oscillospiraceae bacterium]|nr:helix-turn-helix domain-containing protein [Oscillospiraceae bacterium]